MLKLLIVDDEKRTREGLVKCLPWKALKIGTIMEADDGSTALDIAKTFQPDIVLSDIRMPNMEGIEFVEQLRNTQPHCKVIFISGYSDKEYLLSAIKLKAVSYVEKPVNIEELKNAVWEAVNMCLEEKATRESSSLISESKPFIIQELATYLKDPGCKREDLEKMLALSDLDLHIDGNYLASIIKFHYGEETPLNHMELKKPIHQFISSYLTERGLRIISGAKDEACIICYIHISAENNFNTVKRVFTGLADELNRYLDTNGYSGIGFSIGAGMPVSGMEKLYESYQMAVMAEQKSFFQGINKVMFYESSSSQAFSFENDIEETFMKYLSEENWDDFALFLDKLTQNIKSCENTLVHNIKALFYRMLLILYDEAGKRGIMVWPQEVTKECLWSIVLNFCTLEQIKSYVETKVKHYFQESNVKSGMCKAVYEIVQYIRNNYHQSDLDLNILSRHIHLTPAYICQIFKKETGKTINEYLTDYRMDMAKKLLLSDRSAKLFDIASRVGYKDTKYFIRTFRKKAGVTPSEYREKH